MPPTSADQVERGLLQALQLDGRAGTTNLSASVQLRDDRALFDDLTGPITAPPGLLAIQSAPVLRTVEQSA